MCSTELPHGWAFRGPTTRRNEVSGVPSTCTRGDVSRTRCGRGDGGGCHRSGAQCVGGDGGDGHARAGDHDRDDGRRSGLHERTHCGDGRDVHALWPWWASSSWPAPGWQLREWRKWGGKRGVSCPSGGWVRIGTQFAEQQLLPGTEPLMGSDERLFI